MSSFDYPSCPSDSLILSTFTTVYLGSPKLSSCDAATLPKAKATLSQCYSDFSTMWCNSTFWQRSLLVSTQCFQANRSDTWTTVGHIHSPDLNLQILESGNSWMMWCTFLQCLQSFVSCSSTSKGQQTRCTKIWCG